LGAERGQLIEIAREYVGAVRADHEGVAEADGYGERLL
jgi:hypothetical protein